MLVKALLESKPRDIITASLSTPVDEAMDLMISNNIGCLPVVDDAGKPIGIVSDADIFKKIHQTKGEYHQLSVEDIMSTNLIIGVPNDDLNYISGVMAKNWIRHVPIVEGEVMVGLVSLRDIIKTQAENTEIENRYLQLYTGGLGTRDKSAE